MPQSIAMPETLTLRRPDDWHVHLRDGEMLRGGGALYGAAIRPGDRDAEPGAAGDEGGGGAGLSRRASSPPCPRTATSSR